MMNRNLNKRVSLHHAWAALALKATTLFSSERLRLMLGSLRTDLLRFLRNLWLTPLSEAYFWSLGFLIPFWWFLWFWFLDEWFLSLAICGNYYGDN